MGKNTPNGRRLPLLGCVGTHPHAVVNSIGVTGVVTKQVEGAAKGPSNWWVALTSFLALVYFTRVLVRALAIMHSVAWKGTAASVKVRPRSVGIFGAGVFGQLALVAGVGAVNHQTVIGGIIAFPVFVLALAGLWLVVSLELPHTSVRWTDLIPGSLFYAIGIVCIQIFNVLILGELLKEKSTTYGALGIAAALLLGLFLVGRERRSRSRGQQT